MTRLTTTFVPVRLSRSEDGTQIQLTPVTRALRQKVREVEWSTFRSRGKYLVHLSPSSLAEYVSQSKLERVLAGDVVRVSLPEDTLLRAFSR